MPRLRSLTCKSKCEFFQFSFPLPVLCMEDWSRSRLFMLLLSPGGVVTLLPGHGKNVICRRRLPFSSTSPVLPSRSSSTSPPDGSSVGIHSIVDGFLRILPPPHFRVTRSKIPEHRTLLRLLRLASLPSARVPPARVLPAPLLSALRVPFVARPLAPKVPPATRRSPNCSILGFRSLFKNYFENSNYNVQNLCLV
ncbi:hypothetical protein KSP40_PGU005854 [Platanthera guangdongensis]|uniref:Uncharacterized protein n=1 Tax=Platanthera guangdongensis TaxID=2320717 RepID=A0ABR2LEP2_9ASPA